MDLDDIPHSLKQHDQFICWNTEERVNSKGRSVPVKTPIAPWKSGNIPVSAMDPDNHTDFYSAVQRSKHMQGVGVGFVFTEKDDFVGIDLDDCIVQGELIDFAEEIVTRLDSYTEVSPSGTGLHVLIRSGLDEAFKPESHGIEVYPKDRYFTMTGDHYEGAPGKIEERHGEITDIIDRYREEKGDEEKKDWSCIDLNVNSPFWDLSVTDLYPGIPLEKNVSHPEHGSSTGVNFRIHANTDIAVCWRASHQYGNSQGCGLNAQQLLAIRATGLPCNTVRRTWCEDHELVFKAWRQAVKDLGLDPQPVPYRVLLYIAEKYGLPFKERKEDVLGTTTIHKCLTILKEQFDFEISLSERRSE